LAAAPLSTTPALPLASAALPAALVPMRSLTTWLPEAEPMITP
jgi:hypothetical protein